MNTNEKVTLDNFLRKGNFTDKQKQFMIELDFVQCLSNVYYLKWLSDNHYFEDESFLHYLKYLQYWKKPEYSRYLVYPECLFFLDKLQDEAFRYLLSDINHINFLNLQCHLAVRKHSEFSKPVKEEGEMEVEKEVEGNETKMEVEAPIAEKSV